MQWVVLIVVLTIAAALAIFSGGLHEPKVSDEPVTTQEPVTHTPPMVDPDVVVVPIEPPAASGGSGEEPSANQPMPVYPEEETEDARPQWQPKPRPKPDTRPFIPNRDY